jgi:hypothetical protein
VLCIVFDSTLRGLAARVASTAGTVRTMVGDSRQLTTATLTSGFAVGGLSRDGCIELHDDTCSNHSPHTYATLSNQIQPGQSWTSSRNVALTRWCRGGTVTEFAVYSGNSNRYRTVFMLLDSCLHGLSNDNFSSHGDIVVVMQGEKEAVLFTFACTVG